MKFTLATHRQPPAEYWNGMDALPAEIHVPSGQTRLAEFQLLFSADKLFSESGPRGFALDNIRLSYLN